MRSATLSEVSGPNSAVTGRRRNDRAVTDVFESRLIPWGWNIAVEKRGFVPWVRAYAGQARNHVNSDVSPHPQVVVVDGLPDQTCQKTRSESPR